jgi:hypothetical protein
MSPQEILMSNPPTREQQLAEVQRIADQLIELIADRPHGPALDALIAVYRTLAKKFDCCTQNAANQCMATSIELAQHAAVQRQQVGPVAGARVH